jgi:hypothetical protein
MISYSLETSIQGKAPGKKLPFTRFHLGVRPVRDSLPNGMENVPLHVWTDFWSRIDVVAKQVDRLNTMRRAIFLLACAGVLLFFLYLVFNSPSLSITEMLLRALAFVACVFSLRLGFLYLGAYYFSKLKTFCNEEEAQTFLPLGFVLECHNELPRDRPSGYYLYFIPSTTNGNNHDDTSPDGLSCQRGYLRVQLVKDPLCGWNTAPVLPYYDYLPNEMVSVSLADWSEFWGKVDAASSTAVSSTRRHNLFLFMYSIAIFTMVLGNDTVFWVLTIIIIPLLSCWNYYMQRVNSTDSDIESVCNEYNDKFQQQGVYMEFRKELDWTFTSYWCIISGTLKHYIYLFPIVHSN